MSSPKEDGRARRFALRALVVTGGALALEGTTHVVSKTFRKILDNLGSLNSEIASKRASRELSADHNAGTQIDRFIQHTNETVGSALAHFGLKDREIQLGRRRSLPQALNSLRETVRRRTLNRFLEEISPLRVGFLGRFDVDIARPLWDPVVNPIWQAAMEGETVPKLTLIDFAQRTSDGHLAWMSDITNQLWAKVKEPVRQGVEANFNPNPLLHPNQ